MARKSPGQDHRKKQRHGSENLAPPWQPGQSGNPGGRPKGQSLVKILRRFMDEPGTFLVSIPDPAKMTVGELFAHQLLQLAIKGKTAYGREVVRQLCGNPPIRIIHRQAEESEIPDEITDEQAAAAIQAMIDAAPKDRG